MDAVSIRPATEQDLDALCALYYEFHEFHARGVPDFLRSLGSLDEQDWSTTTDSLRRIITSDDSTILVAEVEGKLAGLAEVYLRQYNEENKAVVAKRYGYLQSLAVTESLRRQGVGQRLMEAGHDWTRANGAGEMHLEVWEFAEGPLRFYEKMGYATVRRTLAMKF